MKLHYELHEQERLAPNGACLLVETRSINVMRRPRLDSQLGQCCHLRLVPQLVHLSRGLLSIEITLQYHLRRHLVDILPGRTRFLSALL